MNYTLSQASGTMIFSNIEGAVHLRSPMLTGGYTWPLAQGGRFAYGNDDDFVTCDGTEEDLQKVAETWFAAYRRRQHDRE